MFNGGPATHNKMFFAVFCFVSIAIGILYIFSVHVAYELELSWLDVVLHVLGGLWISFIVSFFILFFLKMGVRRLHTLSPLLIIFISIVIVAFSWEVFEAVLYVTPVAPNKYWPDTISDFMFGVLGSLAGYDILFRRRLAYAQ